MREELGRATRAWLLPPRLVLMTHVLLGLRGAGGRARVLLGLFVTGALRSLRCLQETRMGSQNRMGKANARL